MPRINYTAGILIISLFLATGILGPLFISDKKAEPVISDQLRPPSAGAPFGFDENGYNLFYRIILGARIALIVGLLTTLISAFTGSLIGAISGYFGGITDEVIMRIVDILMSFPGILLSISIIAVTQNPSYAMIIFALSNSGLFRKVKTCMQGSGACWRSKEPQGDFCRHCKGNGCKRFLYYKETHTSQLFQLDNCSGNLWGGRGNNCRISPLISWYRSSGFLQLGCTDRLRDSVSADQMASGILPRTLSLYNRNGDKYVWRWSAG